MIRNDGTSLKQKKEGTTIKWENKYKRALFLNTKVQVAYNCGSERKRNLELVQDWPFLGQRWITDTKWSRDHSKPMRQREQNPKLQGLGREQAGSRRFIMSLCCK